MSRALIVVFDALRPEFVTPDVMPNLCGFADRGTRFDPRSFFPTETRVNQTTVLTGCVPARHGIVANRFVADDLAPGLVLNTGEDAALAGAVERGPVVHVPLLSERLAAAGQSYASLSAGTPGGGRLIGLTAEADGAARLAMRAPDRCFPETLYTNLLAACGPLPDYTPPAVDWIDWAVTAYLEHFEARLRPDAMVLWLCEPDESFHYLGIGSEGALEAIRAVDRAFGRILERLQPALDTGEMHVIAMSDHGQLSIAGEGLDLVGRLNEAGFRASARSMEDAECVVAVHTAGGIWVRDRELGTTARIVEWLQGQDWCGPLFTAASLPGTLALSDVMIDHARAPDIALALSADDRVNSFGAAGLSAHDAPYPDGGGCHGGLSAWETRNVLIAGGARVPVGAVCPAAVGNVDIAPTVLDLLGIDATGMDGRSLFAAIGEDPPVEREIRSASAGGFQTVLNVREGAGRRYLDWARAERV